MKITFAHLCDYAMLSREGKLSVMGIFSGIRPGQLPYVHPQAYLAFEIELSYAEVNRPVSVELQCIDADGNKSFQATSQLTFKSKAGPPKPGDKPKLGQVLGIQNLQFTRACRYDINIFLNGNLSHQIEFEIQAPPQIPPGIVGGTPPALP